MNYLPYLALEITSDQVREVLQPVFEIIGAVVPVLLLLIGSIGSIYCIVLGVKYAKAEDPQEHEKAKKALVNAIVGFVLIFVLLIVLELAVPMFTEYYRTSISGISTT